MTPGVTSAPTPGKFDILLCPVQTPLNLTKIMVTDYCISLYLTVVKNNKEIFIK